MGTKQKIAALINKMGAGKPSRVCRGGVLIGPGAAVSRCPGSFFFQGVM